MTEHPGPGQQDGGEPLPGGPVRVGAAGIPEDDWDPDAEMAAFLAAGTERIPEEWEIEGPAASVSLGDACDVDPAALAAMAGPDGLAGAAFAQGAGTGALRPGPVLAAPITWRPSPSPSSPAAAPPGTRHPGRAGTRAAAGTASSPTPSWRWSWSPASARPAT